MLQFDRAIQDYDQAIKLDPHDAKAFFGRGMMKKMKGDKAGGDADQAHARQLDLMLGLKRLRSALGVLSTDVLLLPHT